MKPENIFLVQMSAMNCYFVLNFHGTEFIVKGAAEMAKVWLGHPRERREGWNFPNKKKKSFD
jgi:hypothetical protein